MRLWLSSSPGAASLALVQFRAGWPSTVVSQISLWQSCFGLLSVLLLGVGADGHGALAPGGGRHQAACARTGPCAAGCLAPALVDGCASLRPEVAFLFLDGHQQFRPRMRVPGLSSTIRTFACVPEAHAHRASTRRASSSSRRPMRGHWRRHGNGFWVGLAPPPRRKRGRRLLPARSIWPCPRWLFRSAQRGFISHGSLADNILDLTAELEAALMVGARLLAPALFYIKSAFPTLAWGWMRKIFEARRVPAWIVRAFCALLTRCPTSDARLPTS